MKVYELMRRLEKLNPSADILAWDKGEVYPCEVDVGQSTPNVCIAHLTLEIDGKTKEARFTP